MIRVLALLYSNTIKTAVITGTHLMFAIAVMSKDESDWGPDANKWRPTRWLTPDGTFNRSAGSSFPFGSGQRACFGQRLAVGFIRELCSES
jgi:cytochrome P450